MIPLNASVQYRLFKDDITESFRPYITAGIGPTMMFVSPYATNIIDTTTGIYEQDQIDFFSSLKYGTLRYTLGGFVGVGAFFGIGNGALGGISVQYTFAKFPQEIEVMEDGYIRAQRPRRHLHPGRSLRPQDRHERYDAHHRVPRLHRCTNARFRRHHQTGRRTPGKGCPCRPVFGRDVQPWHSHPVQRRIATQPSAGKSPRRLHGVYAGPRFGAMLGGARQPLLFPLHSCSYPSPGSTANPLHRRSS